MNRHILDVKVPKDWDRSGLPGWSYHSPALLELETKRVEFIKLDPAEWTR